MFGKIGTTELLLILLIAVVIFGPAKLPKLGKAIGNLIRRPNLFRWLLALGSFLFWFSDLVLAVDMFGQSSRLTWILCSYAYWPAQNILAHALYHAVSPACKD